VAPDPAPRVGIRKLDDLLAVAWFQRQLHRMSEGKDPDPGLGHWSTLLLVGTQGIAHAVRNTWSRPVRDALAPTPDP
jgi:hypothetical protein